MVMGVYIINITGNGWTHYNTSTHLKGTPLLKYNVLVNMPF
jgi:hypothetical protein